MEGNPSLINNDPSRKVLVDPELTELQRDLDQLYSELLNNNDHTLLKFYCIGFQFFSKLNTGHYWCKFPSYMQFMLGTLSIQKDELLLDNFRKEILNQLSHCALCIDEFYTALTKAREAQRKFDADTVERFFFEVLKYSRIRLDSTLKTYGSCASGANDTTASPSLLYAIYEICAYPELLRDPDIHTRFAMTINLMVTGRAKTFTLKKALPGILLSLFSPHKNVRLWSLRSVQAWLIRTNSPLLSFPLPGSPTASPFNDIWNAILEALKSNLLECITSEGIPLYPHSSNLYPLTKSNLHFVEGMATALKSFDGLNPIICQSTGEWFASLSSTLLNMILTNKYIQDHHFMWLTSCLYCLATSWSFISKLNLKGICLSSFGLTNSEHFLLEPQQCDEKILSKACAIEHFVHESSTILAKDLFTKGTFDDFLSKKLENFQLIFSPFSIESNISEMLHLKYAPPLMIFFFWQGPFLSNFFSMMGISKNSLPIYLDAIYTLLSIPFIVLPEEVSPVNLKLVIQSTVNGYRLLAWILSSLLKAEFPIDVQFDLFKGIFSYKNLVDILIQDARCQRFEGLLSHPMIASLSSSIIALYLMHESKFMRNSTNSYINAQFWEFFANSISSVVLDPLCKSVPLICWLPEIHHALLAYIINIAMIQAFNFYILSSFYQRLHEFTSNVAVMNNLSLIYIPTPPDRSNISLLTDALVVTFIHHSDLFTSLTKFCGQILFPAVSSTSNMTWIFKEILEAFPADPLIESICRQAKQDHRIIFLPLFNLIQSLWYDKNSSLTIPQHLADHQISFIFFISWKVSWHILQTSPAALTSNSIALSFICNLFRLISTKKQLSFWLPSPKDSSTLCSSDIDRNIFIQYFESCEWFTILIDFIRDPLGDYEKLLEKRLALELTEDIIYWWTEQKINIPPPLVVLQLRVMLTSTGRLDITERQRLTSLLNTFLKTYSSSALVHPVQLPKPIISTHVPSTDSRLDNNNTNLSSNMVTSSNRGVSLKRPSPSSISTTGRPPSPRSFLGYHKKFALFLQKKKSPTDVLQRSARRIYPLSKGSFISSRLKQVQATMVKDAALFVSRPANKRIAHKLKSADNHLTTIPSSSDSEEELNSQLFASFTTESQSCKPPIKSLGIESVPMSKPIQMIDQVTTLSSLSKQQSTRSLKVTIPPLKPLLEFSLLQRKILSWDLQRFTPETLEAMQVPLKFTDVMHYVHVFEPLLLMECRAQIAKSIEEFGEGNLNTMDRSEVSLNTLTMIDDFYDIQFSLSRTISSSNSSEGTKASDITLLEHDLVFLEPIDFSLRASAIVIHSKNDSSIITCRMAAQDVPTWFSALREKSLWKISKITSLVTMVREFTALSMVASSPYLRYLLDPALLLGKRDAPPSANIMNSFRITLDAAHFVPLNQSQLEAVALVLGETTAPLSLIQGPPGTGKTTVLLALILCILNSSLSLASTISTPLNKSHVFSGLGKSTTNRSTNKPILICAPSNAAIDEIVKRFVLTPAFDMQSIIRLGSQDMISDEVKFISLDSLLEEAEYQTKNSITGTSRFFKKYNKQNLSTLRKQTIQAQIDAAKLVFITAFNLPSIPRWEEIRGAARSHLLQEASVIATTLSGSGHDFITRLETLLSPRRGKILFDSIIIDEACQAIELSTLIPLRYPSKRVILVGDPNQLPPTVISKEASTYAYEQSLFTRIYNQAPSIVNLLSVQYRMHPEISSFPSKYFYQGKLLDGPGMAKATSRDWHQHPLLSSYLFFDVKGHEKLASSSENKGGSHENLHSLSNYPEGEVALGIVKLLCSEFPAIPFSNRIGIISPYRSQVRLIRSLIIRNIKSAALKHIEVNTVDGFQGQEKDIIIFSCVRASNERSIGFLRDTRRLNVGLTRGKSSLFIVGHADVLSTHSIWNSLIKDAKSRRVFIPFSGLQRWRSLFKNPTENLFVTPKNLSELESNGSESTPSSDSKCVGGFNGKTKNAVQNTTCSSSPALQGLILQSMEQQEEEDATRLGAALVSPTSAHKIPSLDATKKSSLNAPTILSKTTVVMQKSQENRSPPFNTHDRTPHRIGDSEDKGRPMSPPSDPRLR